jgi:putative heme-binding domain-containing protein
LLSDRVEGLTPGVRPAALRALVGRGEWTDALLDAAERGKVRLAELSLDQKQALASHPDRRLAERARKLLAGGGGLPDPDRQKVIEELAPKVLRGGDAARGKVVFVDQCAKCHAHSGRGGKVGPDLTGMAVHPREELLVHILDPSRSVEGNFVQYTAAVADGRVVSGLLASETRSALELLDADGKSHVLQRDEVEELAASKKSLMPEGFEKQIPPPALADLLAFLTQRGKYLPLDVSRVATANSTVGMFLDPGARVETLVFPDWAPKTFEGVPFTLVKPEGEAGRNVILLHGPQGYQPPKMPRTVELPVHAPARAVHLLGGVGGWAFPYGEKGSVSLIVRLRYADGVTEDHPLHNGVEIADYIREVDVPGSKLAFLLRSRQVRYLAIRPGRAEPIEAIELRKGEDDTAPIVVAVTVELPESQ